MEKLDAICMQLVAIGEGLKNLDSMTNKKLLIQYPQIEWKKVKGMRGPRSAIEFAEDDLLGRLA